MARLITDGTSDFVDFGTAINPTTAITISCWFYPTAFTTDYGTIVSRYQGSATGDYGIGCRTTGKLACYANGGAVADPGTVTLSLNTWNHIALVYPAAGTSTTLYVNGAVDTTVSPGAWGTSPNTLHTYVGKTPSGFANLKSGRVADVAIWNAALTVGEIKAIFGGVRPYQIRPPIYFWSPLDGLQSPELDLSGNQHPGTVTGTAIAPGPPINMTTRRAPQFIPGAAAAAGFFARYYYDKGAQLNA